MKKAEFWNGLMVITEEENNAIETVGNLLVRYDKGMRDRYHEETGDYKLQEDKVIRFIVNKLEDYMMENFVIDDE